MLGRAAGRPDTSGPDTSGSSGQQPELHRPASLEILSEVCDLAAAGGDLPALDDLERVAQQAAAAEVAAADDGQAASPKASAAPAGKALAAGAAEPIAKRRRVGGGRQLSVETDGTEAKRSSRSASPAVAAAGAAKAAVKVQETTAVPAGAAAATTPEPASAVPQPSPRPEQPQSVSPPPEPSREHASLECSERLVTGPAEEDTVMAEADEVAKMEQQEAAAQAAEGTQEQQGSQQAEQHEPQHEPQRTLSQTLMPPPRSSTPAASGRARTSPEPAFAVPKPLSKAGAAGSGSTSGPASAGPSGAGAASVACASGAPRRSGSGVAPGSGPSGDQEACGTAGQLGASVGAMLDSVKPGGGSYGKQWTAGQEQRGPGGWWTCSCMCLAACTEHLSTAPAATMCPCANPARACQCLCVMSSYAVTALCCDQHAASCTNQHSALLFTPTRPPQATTTAIQQPRQPHGAPRPGHWHGLLLAPLTLPLARPGTTHSPWPARLPVPMVQQHTARVPAASTATAVAAGRIPPRQHQRGQRGTCRHRGRAESL
jgi:hypothetical protein